MKLKAIFTTAAGVATICASTSALADYGPYLWAKDRFGTEHCYKTEELRKSVKETEPVSDENCKVTYTWAYDNLGNKHCYPAKNLNEPLSGRAYVPSRFCENECTIM